METALVTGGLGRSGRWIVDRLAESYRVVCVDLDHPGFDAVGRDGIEFRAADLTTGEAFDLVGEVDPDYVVHWAAIPVSGRHAGSRVFETNALAAYNTLTAAGRAGARIVQASSDSAYGFFFADPTPMPESLPITEDHPRLAEDPYGISKVTAEEIAGGVTRRFGVPVASLRPAWIQFPGDYPCRSDGYVADVEGGAGNFWSYVDVRDVAGLVAAALDADFEGHEAFNAVAADNALGRPLVELMEEAHGGVPAECDVAGDDSAFSMAKAASTLDYRPRHSWREAADAEVPSPTLTL